MLTLIVGVFNAEGPPVPIPNTEVKLCSAENTCRATGREDRSMLTLIVGVFNAEGPPVPIPNTEVKLCSAENTCRATGRENKSMPTPFRKTEMFSCLCIEERTSGQSPVRSPQNASLAQLAERKRCFAPNEANNLADIYGVVIVQFHYIPP